MRVRSFMVHSRVHGSRHLDSIVSQVIPVLTPKPRFCSLYMYILTSAPSSPMYIS
jgi:hypothetical protein